ncbi:unnamed protein product [Allacma fusca]|uniref:Uncharacterized protein n=1 Tax=Allacma fusca TaxID=39272 RepID=A0A8J2KJ46_9HEXA|nr:unnamed protein product [Allacma fusca]
MNSLESLSGNLDKMRERSGIDIVGYNVAHEMLEASYNGSYDPKGFRVTSNGSCGPRFAADRRGSMGPYYDPRPGGSRKLLTELALR